MNKKFKMLNVQKKDIYISNYLECLGWWKSTREISVKIFRAWFYFIACRATLACATCNMKMVEVENKTEKEVKVVDAKNPIIILEYEAEIAEDE